METFYRVSNVDTQQGLWYDRSGDHTGLIHNDFNFCDNSELQMPFDPSIVGWLSAVDDLDELYFWFTRDDIKELQKHGFYIHEYYVTDKKWYDKFKHWVINEETSILGKKIAIF